MKFIKNSSLYLFSILPLLFLVISGWYQGIDNISLLLTGITWLVGFVFLSRHVYRINTVINEVLKFFLIEEHVRNRHAAILKAIQLSQTKLEITTTQIRQINLLREAQPIHPLIANEPVGKALHEIQLKVDDLKLAENNRHWIAEGLAQFGELLRIKEKPNEFFSRIISNLVRYMNVNQGGLFLLKENLEEGQYLELTACYAYDKEKLLHKKIYPGQGILGQCLFEKDLIFLTDIPEGYIKITSGLGLSMPRNIVVIPLMINQKFYGAIELASFEICKPHQIEFLRKVSESIAAELEAKYNLENTNKLLEDSKNLTLELQSSEEELKRNLHELAITQEKMKLEQIETQRKQAELTSYLSAINNTIATAEFDLAGNFISANTIFLKIMGYSSAEILMQNYYSSMMDINTSQIMWENLRLGKFFSGEFKMRDKFGKEIWLSGTFNPIFILGNIPQKVMMCAQFTTLEKEKLNDLSVVVNALKSSLPIVEFNDQFGCKTANEKFLKIFNVSRLNLKNKTIYDFIDPDYADIFDNIKSEILKKESTSIILPMNKGGVKVTYEVSVSVIRSSNGELSRVIVILVKEIEQHIPVLEAVRNGTRN